jgi:hypothetical protein
MKYLTIQLFLRPVLRSAGTAHPDVTRLLSHTEVSVVKLRQSLIWFTHFVSKKAHLHQPLHRSQLSEEEVGGLEEETTFSA